MKTRQLFPIALIATVSLALAGAGTKLVARQTVQQNQQPKLGDKSSTMPGMDDGMPGMDMDHDMPGMKMGQGSGEKDPQAEHGAMDAMSHMHHHQMGPHMYMTKLRGPATPADWAKADEIVKELRESIEENGYKNYQVSLSDGFRIFMPNLPQSEYHFTNYYNGYLESFSFDPTRPTSLLYKKNNGGYDLIGAMYTMPKRVTEDQLNERIPLTIAQWHLHTNLCMPPKEQRGHADLKKFGLQGSILTKEACTEAGGTFYPVIFGWMVHVYPFEDSRERIWGQ